MRSSSLAWLLCLALASTSLPAAAKPGKKPAGGAPASDSDARARELFKQGDRAYAEGRYEEALQKFEEAHRLSGRPLLLFNIGNALERLGRLDEAADKLEQYISYAERAEVDVLAKRVENLRRRAEAKKKLEEERDARGPERAAEQKPEREGEVEARPKRAPETPARDQKPEESNTLGWVLLGAGGVALGAGAAFGFMALGARKDADAACKDQGGQRLCNASAKDAIDRDARYSLFADIGFGVGVIAAGAGAYLLFSSPGGSEQAKPAATRGVALGARPGGGEVRLVGQF